MAYEQRNLRVFLSSSMVEFRAEREKIHQALETLGIANFVFEKEGASGKDPKTLFQEAVPRASVYVGVFGKVCGKWTKAEYDLARTCNVTCHLYFQDIHDSERSDDLKEFRKTLDGVENVPTRHDFTSIEGLTSRILKDLVMWLDTRAGQQTPQQGQSPHTFETLIKQFSELLVKLEQEKTADTSSGQGRLPVKGDLPCLCDRDPQMTTLRAVVGDHLKTPKNRPILLFLPGPANEAHHLFRKRIELYSLRELFPHADENEEQLTVKVISESLSLMHAVRDVKAAILPKVNLEPHQGDQEIKETMVASGTKAFLIVATLIDSECQGDFREPLKHFCEFWANFPDVPDHMLIGGMVCLKEQGPSPGVLSALWRWVSPGSGSSGKAGVFQSAVDACMTQFKEDINFGVFDPLPSPTHEHVRQWLGDERVEPHMGGRYVTQKQIAEGIFNQERNLPMDDLFPKLQSLLLGQKM